MIKTLDTLGIERNLLNVIRESTKTTPPKPIANIVFDGKRLNAFPVCLGTKQGGVLSLTLSNRVLMYQPVQ